jgi:hypothetical protein
MPKTPNGFLATVMGKGYVDGAGDNLFNQVSGIMPAASATGLFIFSDSPNSPRQAQAEYSEKNP